MDSTSWFLSNITFSFSLVFFGLFPFALNSDLPTYQHWQLCPLFDAIELYLPPLLSKKKLWPNTSFSINFGHDCRSILKHVLKSCNLHNSGNWVVHVGLIYRTRNSCRPVISLSHAEKSYHLNHPTAWNNYRTVTGHIVRSNMILLGHSHFWSDKFNPSKLVAIEAPFCKLHDLYHFQQQQLKTNRVRNKN